MKMMTIMTTIMITMLLMMKTMVPLALMEPAVGVLSLTYSTIHLPTYLHIQPLIYLPTYLPTYPNLIDGRPLSGASPGMGLCSRSEGTCGG